MIWLVANALVEREEMLIRIAENTQGRFQGYQVLGSLFRRHAPDLQKGQSRAKRPRFHRYTYIVLEFEG